MSGAATAAPIGAIRTQTSLVASGCRSLPAAEDFSPSKVSIDSQHIKEEEKEIFSIMEKFEGPLSKSHHKCLAAMKSGSSSSLVRNQKSSGRTTKTPTSGKDKINRTTTGQNHQTSAISGDMSEATTNLADSGNASTNDCSLQSQYQFQYQEEFNRMRERLFRVLSKVPIQVETITTTLPQEVGCSSGGGGGGGGGGSGCSSSSGGSSKPQVFNREPLIIKYYSERSLSEILELHFGCSLIKHNYERRLALNTHLAKPESSSETTTTTANNFLPPPIKYSCPSNLQSETSLGQHFATYQQQADLNQQQQQQSAYLGDVWQSQVNHASEASATGGNLQWQVHSAYCETLEQKHKLSESTCVDFRLASISNNRRSTPSILMKEANQQTNKKPSLATNGFEAQKSRQHRRSIKQQQQQLMARSNGTSLEDNNTRAIAGQRIDITASPGSQVLYLQNQMQQQNGNKTKCYQSDEISVGERGQCYSDKLFANQLYQLAPPAGHTFNDPLIHEHANTTEAAHHHSLYHSSGSDQQADHNNNIQLHLYTPQTAPSYLQQQQQQQPHEPCIMQEPPGGHLDQGGGGGGCSHVPFHVMATNFSGGLQPPEQQEHATAIVFRPPQMHGQVQVDYSSGSSSEQQQIIYEQQPSLHEGPSSEQTQQQQQNHAHEQSSTSGLQYYATSSHPQLPGDYHHPDAPTDGATVNAGGGWRHMGLVAGRTSEQLNEHQQQQQQQLMIEPQQTICDSYGGDRNFYMAPSDYSLLYTSSRQFQQQQLQNGVVEVDMTLNGHIQQHQHLNNHSSGAV